jgi:hypothetical protein
MNAGRGRGVGARAASGAAAVAAETTRPDALHVALVLAADGVRLAHAERSRPALVRRLAAYVAERGEHALWPDHARWLRGLLERGAFEAAVELYFGLVGARWDEEWLVTDVVCLGELRISDVMGNAINQADELDPDDAAPPRVRVRGSAFLGEVRVLVRERDP